MRAIIAGGRDYTDSVTFFREMDRIHAERKIELVIEGGQRTRDQHRGVIGGADYWAYMWASSRRVPHVREDSDWSAHGRAAGPKRNQLMIDKYKPDALICTAGGRGTADMIRRAYERGLEVIRINS